MDFTTSAEKIFFIYLDTQSTQPILSEVVGKLQLFRVIRMYTVILL